MSPNPRYALVNDLGAVGLGVGALDDHGVMLSAIFAGEPTIWHELLDWLSAHAVTDVGVRGPVSADLTSWLTRQRLRVTDEGIIGASATIVTWRETVTATASATWFHSYETLATTLDEAGIQAIGEFLRRLPAGAEATVIDAHNSSAALVSHLRATGWPVGVKHVVSPWRVNVECYADRNDVFASADGAYPSIETSNDAQGCAELVAWIRDLGEVKAVIIRDADADSTTLVALVRAAGYQYRVDRATRGDLRGEPGDTYGGVQFHLALRGLGWLVIDLRVNHELLQIVVSNMTSAWHDTIAAMTTALDATEPTVVVWPEEPGAHQLVLRPVPDGLLDVQIRFLRDDLFGKPHDPEAGDMVGRWTVDARDLAHAFLSASKHLLQAVPPVDLNARWSDGEPINELHLLAARLNL